MFGLAERPLCTPPLSGFGWLGLTPAERRQQALAKRQAQQKAAQQRRQNTQQQRAAKRAARVQGRNVATSNPDAARRIEASVNAIKRISQQAIAAGTTALRSRDKRVKQNALNTMRKAINVVNTALAPAQAPTSKLRGLGVCDPNTGIDSDTGMSCDYGGGDIYGGNTYQPGGTGPVIGSGIDQTGLVPGFGMPFGGSPFGGSPFGSGIQAPRGCNTGSNLPRCLIYQMAVDEQQQFYFVFSILQQMYAQLLQIVQQLMQQLQYQQQQPGFPYQGYGPSPYDPYGGYGGSGPYPSPYGAPGIPYMPGGDTSAIPFGYDGGGPFDPGSSMIPSDITQVFPGPGSMGPLAQGPGQASNIISSDSLPEGAGPATDAFSDQDTPVPSFNAVAPPIPRDVPGQASTISQPISAGPGQPNIVVNLQLPGQAPWADPTLPASDRQTQPQLEPPGDGDLESWAKGDEE